MIILFPYKNKLKNISENTPNGVEFTNRVSYFQEQI